MSHVAITGASAGIGEAIARAYAGEGASVTLVARRREPMEALARALGVRTRVVIADLSDVDHAADWIAPAEADLGPIDVLVNNAGVQIVGASATLDLEANESMLRVDLLAPLRIIRAVLPGMIARRSGTLVNVSSMAGIAPTPGMLYYNAAKGGLGAASEALRGELRTTGVNVLTVYPGPVDTALARASIAKAGGSRIVAMVPQGTTDVLARRVVRAVARRQARVIYPRAYAITRYFPNLTRWFLDHFTPPFA